jgi:hypothetical protein
MGQAGGIRSGCLYALSASLSWDWPHLHKPAGKVDAPNDRKIGFFDNLAEHPAGDLQH